MMACSPASRLTPEASNIVITLKINAIANKPEETPSEMTKAEVRADTAAETLLAMRPVPKIRYGLKSLATITLIVTVMTEAKIIEENVENSEKISKNA